MPYACLRARFHRCALQVVGLTAYGEIGRGRANLPEEHMGSLDTRTVREIVEEILEGGRNAFEMRRLKY